MDQPGSILGPETNLLQGQIKPISVSVKCKVLCFRIWSDYTWAFLEFDFVYTLTEAWPTPTFLIG